MPNSVVYFNALAQTSTLDRTSIVANSTTTEQDFSGMSGNGLAEFAAWDVGASGDLAAATLVLWRKVDDSDADSWQVMATLTAGTPRVIGQFPNGKYKVVVTGYAAPVKCLLQGV
ncbi:MAG: hypothetical protein GY764_08105 [Halieaceae bacterium]|nr:hypothetical protein [Halieaceae bacterium]MCP4782138.1 hypothetical protein [Fuerstiella sp.]MCP4852995.1 hypothetical protein [Fuerstiella sp.]